MITYSPLVSARTTPRSVTGAAARPMASMGRLLPTGSSTVAPRPARAMAATASGSQYSPAWMPVSPASSAAISTSMVSQVPPDMQLSP